MKAILKLIQLFCILTFVSHPCVGTAAEATPTANQIAANLREELFPIVESALQEHCGSDCPSFRIEPQFMKSGGTFLDDLGFSRPAEINEIPQLKAVSVSILIGETISQKGRDSLKQIIIHRLGNELSVPVTVQLKENSLTPSLEALKNLEELKNNSSTPAPAPLLDSIKPFAWPLTFVILGLLSLVSIILFFRHQLGILREKENLFKSRQTQNKDYEESDANNAEQDKFVQGVLSERQKDLQWLIEERAAFQDFEALKKVLALFAAKELTSRFQLSQMALSTINQLPSDQNEKPKPNWGELSNWTTRALDRAHWKRLEEERNPLLKLQRLTEEQLAVAFFSLPSHGEKAVMLSSVSKDRWPSLLCKLESNDRIQIGIILSQYQKSTPADRRAMEAALIQRVSESLDISSHFQHSIIEDFMLYLPETESQKIGLELTGVFDSKSVSSIDSLLQRLDSNALLEICMSIEIQTLQVLLPTLSDATRSKIWDVLPKGLRTRLEGNPGLTRVSDIQKDEAAHMKAKAEFLGVYRRFHAGA